MARPQGSKSKAQLGPHEVFSYTKKQRLRLLASLISDRMAEDRKAGFPLPKKIQAEQSKKKAPEQLPLKREELTLSRNTHKPFYASSIHYR